MPNEIIHFILSGGQCINNQLGNDDPCVCVLKDPRYVSQSLVQVCT